MAEEKADEGVVEAKKIMIGVCVMEKKVKCGFEVLSLLLFLVCSFFFKRCIQCFFFVFGFAFMLKTETRKSRRVVVNMYDSVALFLYRRFSRRLWSRFFRGYKHLVNLR